MTKSELINALSMRENLTEKDATEIVNSIFDGFTEALKNGGFTVSDWMLLIRVVLLSMSTIMLLGFLVV